MDCVVRAEGGGGRFCFGGCLRFDTNRIIENSSSIKWKTRTGKTSGVKNPMGGSFVRLRGGGEGEEGSFSGSEMGDKRMKRSPGRSSVDHSHFGGRRETN